MSRTVKERMRSRDGVIAAWVFTALAWGGVVAAGFIGGSQGLLGLLGISAMGWLLVGVVAATAMVFGVIARLSHPIAATIPVVLATPVALIFVVLSLLLIGLDIYS